MVSVFCDLQKNYKLQKAGTSPIDLSAEFATTLYICFRVKPPIKEIRKSLIPQIFVFRCHLSRGVRVNLLFVIWTILRNPIHSWSHLVAHIWNVQKQDGRQLSVTTITVLVFLDWYFKLKINWSWFVSSIVYVWIVKLKFVLKVYIISILWFWLWLLIKRKTYFFSLK